MTSLPVRIGPRNPWLGRVVQALTRPIYASQYRGFAVYSPEASVAQQVLKSVQAKVERGAPVLLAGMGLVTHNTGASLVEIGADRQLRVLSNDEEERFSAVKHCADYPTHAVDVLAERLRRMGKTPADVDAWLLTWNYPAFVPFAMRVVAEEMPFSFGLLNEKALPEFSWGDLRSRTSKAANKLREQLQLPAKTPLIALPHHDNHAAGAWMTSPFAQTGEPVMVIVLDGFGDEGAISVYVVENGVLRSLSKNESITDSLGAFYSILSSTQGGWTTLSSEGRFMGAAAWGDGDRLTNPYYKRLRQLLHLGPNGTIQVNRAMANWHLAGEVRPYQQPLTDILGPPIPQARMWNPDAILRVETIQHSSITRDRVDIAAAVQLVFEDAVFHLVDHVIRQTGAERLILTGGSALNCLCNMRLLERYSDAWYQRNLQKPGRLQLWTPPIPSDAGVTVGAASRFAMLAGARPGPPWRHAFYCGLAPTTAEIDATLAAAKDIGVEPLGNIQDPQQCLDIADFLAYVLAHEGVMGLFQGPAETGPRALGHRSILANPCNPRTLENINASVKFREPIRPLAPMVTRRDAERFFELSPGAAADDYNAYNYMVFTVEAKPEARAHVPAVVHHDGTARVQIVRPETDKFCFSFLEAMGRRLGAEVAVNTSLNVGTPIVQSPAQALETLRRAKKLAGLLLIGDDGAVRLAWHASEEPPKDAGRQLRAWRDAWQAERRASLPPVTA